MAQFTPPLGVIGVFEAVAPFSELLVTGATYEVIAIRSVTDLTATGVNVYQQIYLPVGLIDGAVFGTLTFSYSAELALNPNIVSLKARDGTVVRIPDTWLQGYPDTSYVPYSRIILSIDMGSLPDSIDLTSCISAVTAAAQQTSGVAPTVAINAGTTTDAVPYATSVTMENARIAAITHSQTPQQELTYANEQILLLQQQIAALLHICSLNGITPSPI